jgi:hypothetical protein
LNRLVYVKRNVLLFGGILCLSVPAWAQDTPKFDAFAGYSYFHFNQSQSGGNATGNFNGGNAAAAFYPSKWLGIVGDFGGYQISSIKQAGTSSDLNGNVISYLFGPRIRFATGKVTPFGQVLFGGVRHGDLSFTTAGACAPYFAPCVAVAPESAFAMTVEGGIDINVARHFAFRGQGGYFLTRFPQGNGNGTSERQTQNNVRVSVGIVFH